MNSLIIMAAMSFIELNPGHFHAGLVLNRSYEGVEREVAVFAPDGAEVDAHVKLVEGFNTRAKNPTDWKETVYRGADYLEKFREFAKSGKVDPKKSVVVLAGRNDLKPMYCLEAVKAGFNVLSDKPMAISKDGLANYLEASRLARERGLLFADIMTERHNLWNVEQAKLIRDKERFGEIIVGTPEKPAVEKRSVHHFFKKVDGKPLMRPDWYYDTTKQGEGIVDVTVHFLDAVMWQLFPGETYRPSDIEIVSARRWATRISPEQFLASTGKKIDKPFDCYANGEFVAKVKGVYVKIGVQWDFEAPKGGGDEALSVFRGTKGEVSFKSDATTSFKPALFVNGAPYSGSVVDPGHEAHFSLVMRQYLGWLEKEGMPAAERDNMDVKYAALVKALEKAAALVK